MKAITVMAAQLEGLKNLLSGLQTFSEGSWSAAAPHFVHGSYREGEYVIEAGEVVTHIGFLTDGLARYYYLTREGKEFNKSFALPGHPLTSIISLITGEPAPFFIQALAPCDCLFLPYERMVALSDRYPDWNHLGRKLLERLAIKKERREADFLLLTPQERYQQFLKAYGDLAASIPNYHIASYLGVTEVALSRIRKRLGMTALNLD